jgi:hypothetical protein
MMSGSLQRLRGEMLRSLFNVLKIDSAASVEYLSPLIQLAQRQGSLAIATLNYDRSIELLAQSQDVRCDTGIRSWLAGEALRWDEDGIRLLKLHGSIDWRITNAHEAGKLPLKRVVVDGRTSEEPAIVFGEGGKLRSEGPFLELLLAWSAELRGADNLLVVGYSFRDDHVNELIARWFNGSPDRCITLVDPMEVQGWGQGWGPPTFVSHLAHFRGENPNLPKKQFHHLQGGAGEYLASAVQQIAI